MGVFESLRRGFAVLKGSPALILTIFGFNLITALGMLMVIGVNPTPEKITAVTGTLLVLFPILLLMWIFIEGGIFSAVYGQIKTKQVNMGAFIGNILTPIVKAEVAEAMKALKDTAEIGKPNATLQSEDWPVVPNPFFPDRVR